MASNIIHYAITCELIKRRQFDNPDRLKLGSILVDAGYNGNSHMKISVAGGHKNTYDLDGYRITYGELMKQDDLYLGYYLHLIQDFIYRHFVYDYAISREFNKQRLEAFLKEHPEIDKNIVLANEKSMYGFLRMLREKHNSVNQYLRDIGISEYEIQELKSKLI